MEVFANWFADHSLPLLLVFGILISLSLLISKLLDQINIPSIVTYMLIGLAFGPSLLNLLPDDMLSNLHFLTEATLGFVAFKIGLELELNTLKEEGPGMILTILLESLIAFGVVALLLFFITGNWPISILFGALAPTSAPAGTVAVIESNQAKGPLSRALYTVVGFDDALGVVIFGISLAICKGMITGGPGEPAMATLAMPFKEIGLSIVIGGLLAFTFIQTAKLINNKLALTFGFILLAVGLSTFAHASVILTNMTMGMVIGNDKTHRSLRTIEEQELGIILPLFFILFFTIAGANLHLASLKHLGTIGMVYIFARAAGLTSGAYLGASLGNLHQNVRKFLGFGILSQAGVAIGLALVLKQQLSGLGPAVNNGAQTLGDEIGQTIFTTITVTTFFFELLGPILTKFALKRAGEIEA